MEGEGARVGRTKEGRHKDMCALKEGRKGSRKQGRENYLWEMLAG